MKELKDYLHLYLGCQFVMKIRDTENLTAQMTFGVEALCATFSGKTQDLINPILILRNLSDMTEDELDEILRLGEHHHNGNGLKGFIVGWKAFGAETFKYLLSKHFDLFGLIESGLAIDKTTLPPPANK